MGLGRVVRAAELTGRAKTETNCAAMSFGMERDS